MTKKIVNKTWSHSSVSLFSYQIQRHFIYVWLKLFIPDPLAEDGSGGFFPFPHLGAPPSSPPCCCWNHHMQRRQLPNRWFLSQTQSYFNKLLFFFIHPSFCRCHNNGRTWSWNKHWNVPSWSQLHHPSFSSARLNLSSFYSPPKGERTTPSLSSTMGESLWRAVGSTVGTTP